MEEQLDQMRNLIEIIIEYITKYGLKVIGGIVFLIIGFWISKLLTRKAKNHMEKKGIEPSLIGFTGSLISVGIKVLVVITTMSIIGAPMTSFVAVLGAAGLAIGMALSGTLQNFAGGVLILILKPYKIGDYISVQGHDGIVKDIQIFNTILLSLDNKTIIIPNGSISTSSMTNFSTQPTRRVDWSFGVAYGSDFKVVRDTIMEILVADKRIMDDPAPFVELGEMADSSINFTTRAWVNAADYWGVFFDTNKAIYEAFNAKGIEIPFPQVDVHLDK